VECPVEPRKWIGRRKRDRLKNVEYVLERVVENGAEE